MMNIIIYLSCVVTSNHKNNTSSRHDDLLVRFGHHGSGINDRRNLDDRKKTRIAELNFEKKKHMKQNANTDEMDGFNPDHTKRDPVIRNDVYDLMRKQNDFSFIKHEIQHMKKKDKEYVEAIFEKIDSKDKKDELNQLPHKWDKQNLYNKVQKTSNKNPKIEKYKNYLLNKIDDAFIS